MQLPQGSLLDPSYNQTNVIDSFSLPAYVEVSPGIINT